MRSPFLFLMAFGWVIAVFAVHELQRYLKLKDRILHSWFQWSVVCLAMFWAVLSFGISGSVHLLPSFKAEVRKGTCVSYVL